MKRIKNYITWIGVLVVFYWIYKIFLSSRSKNVNSNVMGNMSTNAAIIEKEARKRGITNEFLIKAILAVVYKESALNTHTETGYSRTANDRIRKIFSKTKNLTDDQLDSLKANDVSFFNFVYSGINGNGTGNNDGYNFRGRGFNQLTGKGNYIAMSKTLSLPLDTKPELLDNPQIAAAVLIQFYLNGFPAAVRSGKYGNPMSPADQLTAYNLAYNLNRGKHALPVVDTTGGYQKGRKYLGLS